MIAAVQMIFQMFSGIFVLRFITQSVPSSARLTLAHENGSE
jgi:hypothetical protein